ncbi:MULTISPECIES: hypothetical protein [unclassified Endozoicomonas]|uniref:hypothetical protein n=1 Tax=unclassified Endozoicomonas TaxID=2644528 RepID=UPI003BB69A74
MDDTFLTLGANRYYAKSMVGYAIKSQEPDRTIYRRNYNTATGELGDWEVYRITSPTDYRESDLDTPFSDELTAALTIPTPMDGNVRLKTVLRKNRDQFSRSDKIIGDDGKSVHYEIDLNTKYLFWDAPDSKATLDLRVTNLFNKLPHTDTTAGKRYQMGRAYWVGLSYTL